MAKYKQNPKYWVEVEIDNGIVVPFTKRYKLLKDAHNNAVKEMSPLGEGWRIFVWYAATLTREELVVKGKLTKVKNISEVY